MNEFLAAVFEEDPPYRAVEALHSRTGGNPFFLEELVAGAGDLQHRRPGERSPAVDGGRGGAAPGRRPRPRRARGGVGDVGARSPRRVRPARRGDRRGRGRADRAPPHRRRRRADRRGRRRRVQLPPRPRPRGDRGRAARTRAPTPPRGGARRHAGRRQPRPRRPHPPRPGRRSLRRDGGGGSPRRRRRRSGSAPPTRRCSSPRPGSARPTTTSTCAPWPPRPPPWSGLLDDAAEHGDQWLAHARAQGDVTHEARALSLRMRIAFDLGDLPAMARFTDELVATVDQVPVRRGPRPGDDLRGAVAPAPRPRRAHLRVGRQGARASPRPTGSTPCASPPWWRRGRRSSLEPGSAAEGRALLEEAAEEAARTGDDALAAQALEPLVWLARVSSRLDDARLAAGADAEARRGRRVRPAGHLRPRRGRRLARGRRRRPRRRARGARAAPPRRSSHHLGPQPPMAVGAPRRPGPRGGRPPRRRRADRGGQAGDAAQPGRRVRPRRPPRRPPGRSRRGPASSWRG